MVRRTRSFAAAIPGARVHRIEGAAHAAPFDATDKFVQLIRDTIREGAAALGIGSEEGGKDDRFHDTQHRRS